MRNFFPIQPPVMQRGLLDANYRYREYLPSEGLNSYVACYWTVDYDASETNHSHMHRIIPDGCIDIIFDLQARSLSQGAFVAGLMPQFEAVNFSHKQSKFGVRFFADTVNRFIRYPVAELTGKHVLLEDIWGDEALLMLEELLSANGISEMIERLELKLQRCLEVNDSRTDQLLQTSMQYLYSTQGMISMRSLAEKLSYSERNVRRTFQKELGISPKEFSGIIRFQSLLKELYHQPPSRLSDVALKYGYSDQSHFNNNFKRYYGLSPHQVL